MSGNARPPSGGSCWIAGESEALAPKMAKPSAGATAAVVTARGSRVWGHGKEHHQHQDELDDFRGIASDQRFDNAGERAGVGHAGRVDVARDDVQHGGRWLAAHPHLRGGVDRRSSDEAEPRSGTVGHQRRPEPRPEKAERHHGGHGHGMRHEEIGREHRELVVQPLHGAS